MPNSAEPQANSPAASLSTTFVLIRHGSTPNSQSLLGRQPGISLDSEGRRQVERIAEELTGLSVSALYASPMDRTYESAEIIGKALCLPTQIDDEIVEVDFGTWTGREFCELDKLSEWRLFNSFRSHVRIPGGEMMVDVQRRVLAELSRLETRHRGDSIVVVTHGEIIRTALCYYAAIPFDLMLRIKIDFASVSIVSVDDRAAEILCINAAAPPRSLLPARSDAELNAAQLHS